MPSWESDDTVVVDGKHYFPRESLREEFVEPSDHRSVCFPKGQAQYLTVVVDGKQNKDAPWYYPEPKAAVNQISGRVVFWQGVSVAPVNGRDAH